MDFLINLLIWSTSLLLTTTTSYIVVPVLKLTYCYLFYCSIVFAFKLVLKLRYELFNEDLKYKRHECLHKVVVVTGATSGIGLAVARHFHARGFVVVACYYSSLEPGYQQLVDLDEQPGDGPTDEPLRRSMHLVELDVCSSKSIEACYESVKAILASDVNLKLHALVNVAGIGAGYRFQYTPRKTIRDMVETNLLGPMFMTRQFLHLLVDNRPDARVIFVASPLAFLPSTYNAVYGATKAGLTQFSNCLARDLASFGIKSVTVHPGNLIKNTAVINSTLQSKLDDVLPELNEHEKQLYGKQLDHQLSLIRKLEKELQKKEKSNLKLSTNFSLKKNLIILSEILGGGVDSKNLHECISFLQPFDNSVRMRNPPKEMVAGNQFYNIVCRVVFDYLSRETLRCIDVFAH